MSRAAPKAETASGPAVCSQFSHLHISQHLSNNELLMPKASSLTKYYFPLHPAEAEAQWLGESSGKKGLCPAMSTGLRSLFRNSIEIRSTPEAKSTPAWHTWGSSHESTAELPSHRANHSIPLWGHFSPTVGQRALQPPFPQLADECSINSTEARAPHFQILSLI